MRPNKKRIMVKVASDSFGTHTHQIFSGLKILARQGLISLVYTAPPSWLRQRTTRQMISLELNSCDTKKWHIYDLNDSADIAHQEALRNCDYYHKRSFSKNGYSDALGGNKIFPLGFNYQISAGSMHDYLMRVMGDFIYHPCNPLQKKQRPHIENIFKYGRDLLAPWGRNRELLNDHHITRHPKSALKNQVLFQCRLWDPMFFPAHVRESIQGLNDIRINTVQSLQKEFGERFIGGIQNNEYAQRSAKHFITKASTNRSAYLRLVRDSAVVITTNGISDSIGWKMGEFVALSKAIVCEPIEHVVSGEFMHGVNYLQYTTVQECLNSCSNLLEDNMLNEKISENNFSYYNRYLRPDMLMLNSFYRSKDFALLNLSEKV